MRNLIAALVMVVACSGAAFAATRAQTKPAKAAAKSTVASHATSGVVKSVDSSTLVIAHGNKDLTFAVNSSTQKDGTVAPGSNVTVRYQNEGKAMVATAISERPVKARAKK
jgi:hypothetical protein